jgi:hypothetical protein
MAATTGAAFAPTSQRGGLCAYRSASLLSAGARDAIHAGIRWSQRAQANEDVGGPVDIPHPNQQDPPAAQRPRVHLVSVSRGELARTGVHHDSGNKGPRRGNRAPVVLAEKSTDMVWPAPVVACRSLG